MLKQLWIDFEKKAYDEAPVNPYELTAEGLSELRKSIIVSTLSLAALSFTILFFFRYGSFSEWGRQIGREIGGGDGSFLPILFFLAFLGLLFGSSHMFGKSIDRLAETGLWMRLSVSDRLQDEWEMTEKRKSYTFAYNSVFLALIFLFVLWLIACGGHYAAVGSLPPPPRFGTVVVLSIVALWMMTLAPMAYTAWTLDPVNPEDIDGPIVKPESITKALLTARQKLRKYGTTPTIFVVFFAVGYFFATNN